MRRLPLSGHSLFDVQAGMTPFDSQRACFSASAWHCITGRTSHKAEPECMRHVARHTISTFVTNLGRLLEHLAGVASTE